jgi:hypothetical protein
MKFVILGYAIENKIMKIDWDKIVTQAITALVVAVFLGAATIVWKGATSVDDKVQSTREDMQHLITSLSDKMAGYEIQLTSLSNQLMTVSHNQSNILAAFQRPVGGDLRNSPSPKIVTTTNTPNDINVLQQKVFSQDIMKQLKR